MRIELWTPVRATRARTIKRVHTTLTSLNIKYRVVKIYGFKERRLISIRFIYECTNLYQLYKIITELKELRKVIVIRRKD